MVSRVDTGLQTVTVTVTAQGATQQAAIAAQGTAIAAQGSAMTALNVSMQSRLDAAIVATLALGSDTIYTQWGSKVCSATGGLSVTKLFDGWTFGAHHGTRPTNPTCHPPTEPGGDAFGIWRAS